MSGLIAVAACLAALCLFFHGRNLALARGRASGQALHSRAVYHGTFLALCAVGPVLAFLCVWAIASGMIIDNRLEQRVIESVARGLSDAQAGAIVALAKDHSLLSGTAAQIVDAHFIDTLRADYRSWSARSLVFAAIICAALAAAGTIFARRSIAPRFRARQKVELVIRAMLLLASVVAIVTTFGIVLSLIFESLRFFRLVGVSDFVFGLHWSPQGEFEGAGAEARAANSKVFGAVPLLAGTALITVIALCVAAPVGLLSAIYLSNYASRRFRATVKPLVEILAGIPTVVYGFFAALVMAPAMRQAGEEFGVRIAPESALAAGLVMGIMIIPFVSSLSDDVINSVPQSLHDGSAGLGATKSETIRKVILPAALPGIVSALILAISRAVGETMIVVMAAGLAANLTANPFQAVTTVTVQIVTLLVGDQEFDSAKTLAAFALGLLLFVITLGLNVVALLVVRRYREQYD